MSIRREFMSYIGTAAIGGIAGYYAGAQELLGIQSEEAVRLSTDETPAKEPTTEESPTETEEPPTETEEPPTETEEPFNTFEVRVDATDIFLHQYDYGSYAATESEPIQLSEYNIQPGDQITIEVLGEYTYHPSGSTKCQFVGVFSEDDRILDNNQDNRIPGAVDTNENYVAYEDVIDDGVDIPEVFFISGDRSNKSDCNIRITAIQVPPEASYLFIGVEDQNLSDNSGEVTIRIRPPN